MVTFMLDSEQLSIELSGAERALAFRKGNIDIPRQNIDKVQIVDDLWSWIRGIRAPGTRITGVLAAGRWRAAQGDDFVLIRRRLPGVVVDLSDHDEFQRLILSTRHAAALVRALHLDDVDDDPTDVTDLAEPTE